MNLQQRLFLCEYKLNLQEHVIWDMPYHYFKTRFTQLEKQLEREQKDADNSAKNSKSSSSKTNKPAPKGPTGSMRMKR